MAITVALLLGAGPAAACGRSTARAPSTATGIGCPATAGGWASGELPGGPLGRPVRYLALVPPGTARGDRPVLVLLRGSGADEQQWRQIGLQPALRQLTSASPGSAPLVLTPDIAQALPNLAAVEGFLQQTLLPLASHCWGASTDPALRAIGGISSGGGTALRVAAARPDLFRVVGGHSAAVDESTVGSLSRALAAARTRVWLDAGQSDGARPGVEALRRALAARHQPVTFREAPGQHNRAYWHASLPAYLRFYLGAIN